MKAASLPLAAFFEGRETRALGICAWYSSRLVLQAEGSMDKSPGILSKEDREKVLAWLEQYGGGPCSQCHQSVWTTSDHLVHTPIFSPYGGLVVGGSTYPLVLIACANCGFVRFVSALILGLDIAPSPERQASDVK
jgi:hypothetical protein